MNNLKKLIREKQYKKIALIVFLIVSFWIIYFAIYKQNDRHHLPPSNESVQWDAPAHFTFKGNTYLYRYSSYELPEGYIYAGKTNSLPFSESNVDGIVFLNEENLDIAYFRWNTWNKMVDGPEPYLCFTIEK